MDSKQALQTDAVNLGKYRGSVAVHNSSTILIKMAEQHPLENRLHELEASARNKIIKYPALREGQAKDLEASLEQDFSGMRRVIRELESLAEDQEWVAA